MPLVWRDADPSDLDFHFVEDLIGLFEGLATFYVTYGRRSLEEQAELYEKYLAGGPKAAPAGESPHNFGLAIDVVLDVSDKPGLQPSWDITKPEWQALFRAVAAHPRLKSGVSFKDGGHVERFNWRAHKPK